MRSRCWQPRYRQLRFWFRGPNSASRTSRLVWYETNLLIFLITGRGRIRGFSNGTIHSSRNPRRHHRNSMASLVSWSSGLNCKSRLCQRRRCNRTINPNTTRTQTNPHSMTAGMIQFCLSNSSNSSVRNEIKCKWHHNKRHLSITNNNTRHMCHKIRCRRRAMFSMGSHPCKAQKYWAIPSSIIRSQLCSNPWSRKAMSPDDSPRHRWCGPWCSRSSACSICRQCSRRCSSRLTISHSPLCISHQYNICRYSSSSNQDIRALRVRHRVFLASSSGSTRRRGSSRITHHPNFSNNNQQSANSESNSTTGRIRRSWRSTKDSARRPLWPILRRGLISIMMPNKPWSRPFMLRHSDS